MSHINDLITVLRGLRLVVEAGIKYQQESASIIMKNSTLPSLVKNFRTNQSTTSSTNADGFKDIFDRASVVAHGFRNYIIMQAPNFNANIENTAIDPQIKKEIDELNKDFNKTFETLEKSKLGNEPVTTLNNENVIVPLEKLINHQDQDENNSTNFKQHTELQPEEKNTTIAQDLCVSAVPKPVAKKKIRVSLSENSKARSVPSSRIGRMISFGSLAAGLGFGTVAQYARNTIQSVTGQSKDSNYTFLSPANAERIVDTLCKVRGAALKLGQLLSIQDDTVISPELQRIFERVRQSADFMPTWQVEKVLSSQLGSEWRSKLKYFEDKPFAAASIGQVHLGVLHNGQEVAIKVQYPGVAKGIDSDIDNLVGVLKVWDMFPKGMFIDNIVTVAKKELSWEVDYLREAECTKKFKRLLEPYTEYYVPGVIDELCAAEVITTELIDGLPLDKMFNASYEIRHDIAYKIMLLCLREMFVLRCMQTDPNWANFFYNPSTRQIILLDFGATREYSKEFMDQYIEIIKAASDGDRDTILRMSRQMKFLTGYESKVMEDTHVDTVMIMGEVFTSSGSTEFDFGAQQTTKRIQALVPTILHHRLCPPPEEIYSLHRKLSGVFLMCSKMKIKMNCRDMFYNIYQQYKNNSFS